MRQTGARTYFIRSAYFIQEECIMKTLYKNIALFVGGSLFGSAGIKLLGSKDAKNAYTHAAAAEIEDAAEEIADEMAADAAPAEA